MLVQPMREELTNLGISELLTAADVDAAFAKPGTTMVVVNSVCGCAAGGARRAAGSAQREGGAAGRRSEAPAAVAGVVRQRRPPGLAFCD